MQDSYNNSQRFVPRESVECLNTLASGTSVSDLDSCSLDEVDVRADLCHISLLVEELRLKQRKIYRRYVREAHEVILSSSPLSMVAEVIMRAIEDPELFVFSELMHCGALEKLNKSEMCQANNLETSQNLHSLLEVFAYGTVSDYLDSPAFKNKHVLSEKAIFKLRQLTFLSLVRDNPGGPNQVYKLTDIAVNLRLQSENNNNPNEQSTIDRVTALIITCIEEGLVDARIDSAHNSVTITACFMRDVRVKVAQNLLVEMNRWYLAMTGARASISNDAGFAGNIAGSDGKARAVSGVTNCCILQNIENVNAAPQSPISVQSSQVSTWAPVAKRKKSSTLPN